MVDYLLDTYLQQKQNGEKFSQFVNRVGKRTIKDQLKPFTLVPAYTEDKSFYTDWGDAREYTIGDIGIGECAGEVVTLTDFDVAEAESVYFDATLLLEGDSSNGNVQKAADKALESMIKAAYGLLKVQNIDIKEEPQVVIDDFRRYFYDTELIFDPFARGKFASYLFNAFEQRQEPATLDRAKQLIEEARLFIEAAHECQTRMVQAGITTPVTFNRWLREKQGQALVSS